MRPQFFMLFFLLQLVLFTVDGDPLKPTGGVDRYTSHETFSRHFHPCAHITLWLKVSQRVSHEKHVHPHVITCLSVRCFLVLSSSSVSRASTFSLTSTCSLSWSSTSMWSKPPSTEPNAHLQNEEYCPVAIHNPLTIFGSQKFEVGQECLVERS